MSSRKIFWSVCAVLFVIGVFLRLWHLGEAAFGADNMEFYKLALRNQDIVEFWKNPPWLNQIPLNETFSLLMLKLGLPATPFVVRLPFALMGIAALFFIWQFARKRGGDAAALVVLFLAVFNPYQLYFSRTAYHYSGALCWSASLFCVFWAIKEKLEAKEAPTIRLVVLWFATAALACHMHMSVWVAAGLQGALLLGIGAWQLRTNKQSLIRFLVPLACGAVALGLLLLPWIRRALQRIGEASSGGKKLIGADAGSEFFRLLPAYFAGESLLGGLLLGFVFGIALFAVVKASEKKAFLRSLGLILILHLIVLIGYVAVVGGGVAKIAYFSALWPILILFLGIGASCGIEQVSSKPAVRAVFRVLLVGGYAALAIPGSWAVASLDGKPTPYHKINAWMEATLPKGTPVLLDRWLEPWNELQVHNTEHVHYTFTVPDEPIENYKRLNWRGTAEQFFEKYPQAALLEVSRDKYEDELGKWSYPEQHFARIASITNDAAMTMRKLKIFPSSGYAKANTNRVVVRVFYNTKDDLIARAHADGQDVLRLYGEGWGYAKPGWQQGRFEDFRTFTRSASVEIYNLTDALLVGSLEVAAAAQQPKSVSLEGQTTVFSAGRIKKWAVPLTLQPGLNRLEFSSPVESPLFVLDLRWTD